MSDSEFEAERFPSDEALLRDLQERSDDIESVTFQVVNGIYITGPQGETRFCRNGGAFIELCGGRHTVIHREDGSRTAGRHTL